MSEFSTPLPSGLCVREIKTKVVGGKTVPDLDANGQEQELSVVHVPLIVEAAEGTALERKAVIDGFVADIQARGVDLALVRADARMAKQDPNVAETAFTTAQAAGAAAAAADAAVVDTADTAPVQLGGLR